MLTRWEWNIYCCWLLLVIEMKLCNSPTLKSTVPPCKISSISVYHFTASISRIWISTSVGEDGDNILAAESLPWRLSCSSSPLVKFLCLIIVMLAIVAMAAREAFKMNTVLKPSVYPFFKIMLAVDDGIPRIEGKASNDGSSMMVLVKVEGRESLWRMSLNELLLLEADKLQWKKEMKGGLHYCRSNCQSKSPSKQSDKLLNEWYPWLIDVRWKTHISESSHDRHISSVNASLCCNRRCL